MTKEQIGKLAIKVAVYAGLIAILSLFFILRAEDDSAEEMARIAIIRYIVYFFVFGLLIPSGAITYEWLVGQYIQKKMVVKVTVAATVVIVGSVMIWSLWTPLVAQIWMLIALLSLAYSIMPTVRKPD